MNDPLLARITLQYLWPKSLDSALGNLINMKINARPRPLFFRNNNSRSLKCYIANSHMRIRNLPSPAFCVIPQPEMQIAISDRFIRIIRIE